MRVSRLFLCCSAIIAVGIFQADRTPQAQQPQQSSTFRTEVQIVELAASVLDRNRQPVRGLTASDFTILEDGKPRPVTAFAAVDVSKLATARQSLSDPRTMTQEGRLVIVVLDRSIPTGAPSQIARLVATSAVKAMGPNDLAAVIYTGASQTSQDLTGDRDRLLASIAGVGAASRENPETSARDEIARDRTEAELWTGDRVPRIIPDFDISGECMCGLCVPETITHVANVLERFPRRSKSILFIGTDIAIESRQVQCSGRVRDARQAMFRAIDVSNATVHTIDASGLETRLISASSPAQGRELTGAISPGQGSAGLVSRTTRRHLERQGNLAVLPDRTGGRFVVNTNDPHLLISNVFSENSSYYVLGFNPAGPPDGKTHQIRVRVDQRGLDVHARRAYVRGQVPRN